MADKKLLKTGIIGAIIMAICCFTKVLIVMFGAMGLSAWVSGIDIALIPLLIAFLALIVFALMRRTSINTE
jgi:mercuric ion transport protein